MTTFFIYGEVAYDRQREIIRGLSTPHQAVQSDAKEIADALFRKLQESGVGVEKRA